MEVLVKVLKLLSIPCLWILFWYFTKIPGHLAPFARSRLLKSILSGLIITAIVLITHYLVSEIIFEKEFPTFWHDALLDKIALFNFFVAGFSALSYICICSRHGRLKKMLGPENDNL